MSKKLNNALLISGLALGLMLAFQLKSPFIPGGSYLVDELEAQEELVKQFVDEQTYYQSRISTLRKQIEEAQIDIEAKTEGSNTQILSDLKMLVGLTNIEGSGVQIILDDSPLSNRLSEDITDAHLIQATDIRDVINVLNAADAEGISVNGQRVIATSTITSVGSNILINNVHAAPPFTIDAVGDRDLMMQRLLTRTLLESLYDKSLKSKIIFKIALKDFFVIPMYNGELKADNLNLIDEA